MAVFSERGFAVAFVSHSFADGNVIVAPVRVYRRGCRRVRRDLISCAPLRVAVVVE